MESLGKYHNFAIFGNLLGKYPKFRSLPHHVIVKAGSFPVKEGWAKLRIWEDFFGETIASLLTYIYNRVVDEPFVGKDGKQYRVIGTTKTLIA